MKHLMQAPRDRRFVEEHPDGIRITPLPADELEQRRQQIEDDRQRRIEDGA